MSAVTGRISATSTLMPDPLLTGVTEDSRSCSVRFSFFALRLAGRMDESVCASIYLSIYLGVFLSLSVCKSRQFYHDNYLILNKSLTYDKNKDYVMLIEFVKYPQKMCRSVFSLFEARTPWMFSITTTSPCY